LKYYETKEVAEMFQVHPETIKREVQRHRLQCFKVGTELRFTQDHIDQYTNVIQFGKTTREIELEQENEQLRLILANKDKTLENIKTELLKAN
jgi:excisionase family DNA binding protein